VLSLSLALSLAVSDCLSQKEKKAQYELYGGEMPPKSYHMCIYIRVLEGRAVAVAGTFNAQGVANTLWAYATMGGSQGRG